MIDTITVTATQEDTGDRLDTVMSRRLSDLSRSRAAELVRDGHIRVNGGTVKPAYRVAAGDRIEINEIRPKVLSAAPEAIAISIVYQDADLAVVDKPAGLVVHPAPGHEGGTLANALAARFPEVHGVGADSRPGIVHRLDKDTSGLMVVALTPRSHADLQRQIASREAGRRYLALAGGKVDPSDGMIDAPIGRDPRDRKRMAVHGVASRAARTSYSLLESLPGFSLLDVRLRTGRTHQIRVHLSAIGHPVAGDVRYHGAVIDGLSRQFLHSYQLTLRSPSSGEMLEFSSPLPGDLQRVLDRLRS